jgi:DNA-binding transcriptional ArsR family regulator
MTLPGSRTGNTGITVLPCSRQTSRTVGPLAWVVLEDLALRSQDSGDPAIETNVRALASDLGVGKDTVARALARLIDLGLVRCQPQRRAGRYAGSAYELDVDACRHLGLVLGGPTVSRISIAEPCPVQPDPAHQDAIGPDTAAAPPAEPAAPAPAQGPSRASPQPVSQSLFDLPDEPSPSPAAQPSSEPPLPPPLSPSAQPSHPVPEPALPNNLPPRLARSYQPDALAPGVRRGPVNVAGNRAGGRSALNGNLNGEAGSGC